MFALVAFGLVAGGAAFFLFAGRDSSSSTTVVVPSVVAPTIPTGPVEPPPTPVSALHTTRLTWTTDVKVDAPGRIGALEAFDALANWDWAQSIATAWWSDAKPYQLVIDPVGPDGMIDLTVPAVDSIPASAKYHFVSNDCRASETKRAETEVKFEKSSCTLEVEVTGKGVSVRLDLIAADQGGGSKPIARPPCGIGQVFSHLAATHKLTTRPTYSIWLENDVFGYRYSVSAGRGSAQMDALDVSPSFCVKAGVAQGTVKPSTTTTAPPTAKPSTDPEFDRGAAAAAMKNAGIDSCFPTGTTGTVRVTVVFDPSGSAQSAKVDDANAGTPLGACAIAKARAVRVPPFGGSPVTLTMPVSKR